LSLPVAHESETRSVLKKRVKHPELSRTMAESKEAGIERAFVTRILRLRAIQCMALRSGCCVFLIRELLIVSKSRIGIVSRHSRTLLTGIQPAPDWMPDNSIRA